jgi:type IV secretory pathway VirB10-like protein
VENIERILAGLIILALLTLLILIAFPVSRPEPGRVPGTSTTQEANRAPPPTQTTEKPASPPPASETRTEQRPAEPPKKPQPLEETPQKNTRVGNGSEQSTEQRYSEESGRADTRRDRRASADRDCDGRSCDCCCGRERRYRTVERERQYRTVERRQYRRKPAARYLPEPDDDDDRYWAERRRRGPYWAYNQPYWAQIPPGACPE